MTSKNILITSIGSKTSLIHCVKNAIEKFDTSMKIIGADSRSNSLGHFFIDEFWNSPTRDNLTFDILLKYCQSKNISYIIPTSDADVLFFSTLKKDFLTHKIHIFSPTLASVELCNDKFLFAQSSSYAIQTVLDINLLDCSSYVVKERFGAGSKNILINASKKDALEFSKKLSEPIYQPFIVAKEYSVDTYLTTTKQIEACIIRKRDIIIDGEAKVTTYIQDKQIEKIASDLVQKLNLEGHSVMQFFKTDTDIHLIECNTRFGGASTLSYKMGLESFYWFLCECEDKSFEFKINTNYKKQIRVQKDLYFED